MGMSMRGTGVRAAHDSSACPERRRALEINFGSSHRVGLWTANRKAMPLGKIENQVNGCGTALPEAHAHAYMVDTDIERHDHPG